MRIDKHYFKAGCKFGKKPLETKVVPSWYIKELT
jgi:hypothetical protein